MTHVVRTRAEYRAACDAARAEGKRVGLVPTMGALHAGHLALVREAKSRADFVAASIFVNPLQFGEGEDLDRYPRTFEADLAALDAEGADLCFAPEIAGMYPDGFQTTVSLGALTEPLEGGHRPGHFDGVTTVVTKLLNLTGPAVAVFGRKDYQQFRILSRMVTDLDMPIEMVGLATVREADGLALSSRNRYLSDDERRRALGIADGLRAACDAFEAGERNAAVLRELVAAPVNERFDRVDYVAARDPETLLELDGPAERVHLLVAAHLGGTRLIDNLELGVDPRP